jgi:hypothetical protein
MIMKVLAATCRHGRTLGSFLALSLLLLFGREACADCLPTSATPAHGNTSSHLWEAVPGLTARGGCNRESPAHPASYAAAVSSRLSAAMEASKWSLASTRSAEQIAAEHAPDASAETPVQQSLSGVHWADSRDWIHNPPEWLQAAKNYKRQGMPILHLLQSQDKSTSLALGVSNHGKPGLYLTQKLPF